MIDEKIMAIPPTSWENVSIFLLNQKGDGPFDQWGDISVLFGLCISELCETQGAKQGVPYGPYGPP